LGGFRFRQQHPIGPYIADFFCAKAGLIVEVDGDIHDFGKRRRNDSVRDFAIRKYGLRILRIRNFEIMNALDDVLQRILSLLLTDPKQT